MNENRETMLPEPRQAEPTRDALLAAGTALFAERGFEGAKVGAIAARAGANKAMINYHFGGKQGLYSEVLAAIFSDASRRLAVLRGSDRTADAKLAAFVEIFLDLVQRDPALPAMVLREVLSGGRHLDDSVLPYFLDVFTAVRDLVEQGTREGTFRAVNPMLTHLTLVGSLVFFFGTRPFRERLIAEGRLPAAAPTGEAFGKHLIELMNRGLAIGHAGSSSGRRP